MRRGGDSSAASDWVACVPDGARDRARRLPGPETLTAGLMNTELHVIFGTAALGQAVMRQLAGKGKRVRMVGRSGRMTPVEPVPDGVEVVKGDAADPQSTRGVCQGAS